MSKNLFCDIKKLILWYQIIAPINNLINAHALNFVSAGIGNTPAFFFAWESLFHQLKILHILISQKRFCKSARIFDTKKSILWYKNIKFVTSKDRFSAKSQRFFLISQNVISQNRFCDIYKKKKFISLWYHKNRGFIVKWRPISEIMCASVFSLEKIMYGRSDFFLTFYMGFTAIVLILGHV